MLRKRTAPPGDSSQKKKPKQARKTLKAPDTKKGDGAAPGGGGAAHGGDGAAPRLWLDDSRTREKIQFVFLLINVATKVLTECCITD